MYINKTSKHFPVDWFLYWPIYCKPIDLSGDKSSRFYGHGQFREKNILCIALTISRKCVCRDKYLRLIALTNITKISSLWKCVSLQYITVVTFIYLPIITLHQEVHFTGMIFVQLKWYSGQRNLIVEIFSSPGYSVKYLLSSIDLHISFHLSQAS